MSRERGRSPQKSAGAFLGPDLLVPAPMRTLSDEYEDRVTYPEDEHVPEPERPGLIRRLVDRLLRRSGRAR